MALASRQATTQGSNDQPGHDAAGATASSGWARAGPEQANALSKDKKSAATYVLLDPDGKVGREYGAKTTPHMYVIDGKGILRYEGAIDSVSSTDQADIKDATNYVAAAVDAVMAGKNVDPSVTQSYGCGVKY